MNLEHLIIEDQRKRGETRWEPIPLYAPTPEPRRPVEQDSEHRDPERRDSETSGTVIIIDMGDYSETRL